MTPCTHAGIGLPGCPTCDPREQHEGGPQPDTVEGLRRTLEETHALLRRIQWSPQPEDKVALEWVLACPDCDGRQPYSVAADHGSERVGGHKEGCDLARLIGRES